MDQLRLNVTPHANGYVAESRAPQLTAIGASPQEAAENARLMALAAFGKSGGPTTLIVRINEPGRRTIVMQPANMPASFVATDEGVEWRYIASITADES